MDKEPETRKEKAINLAKQHGYTIQPLNVNKSHRSWEILDEQTLVAPLTTIKGMGDKAIDQILAHRPFNTIEEFLFNENIVKMIASRETNTSGLQPVLIDLVS